MHVEHFMTREVVTCEPEHTVGAVARLMKEKNVGSVVVTQNRRVVGIVNDRMLTVGVLAEDKPRDTRVRDVMTKKPATVTVADNIFSVLDTMRSAGVVRRVPVVDENEELVGLVSMSDVAVIAQDLITALLRDETRHSLKEAHVPTGGKEIEKTIRSPAPKGR